MDVAEAVEKRMSVRAFRPDAVPAETVRAILQTAHRAPSGGNLQPWRVYALTGAPLADLKTAAMAKMAQGGEAPEYHVYPPNLWDPFRTRRYECGEDLYASIGIPREDKPARLMQMAKNAALFGAPVGLFFTLDRKVGPPQWADVGMFMQTVMLLALEHGLDTCAQEFWARLPQTVGAALDLPDHEMLFSGMALGYRDEAHPINTLRTRRDPFDAFATMTGF
jgi:nitroreductase